MRSLALLLYAAPALAGIKADPVAQGTALRTHGQYAEARALLEKTVRSTPTPEARMQLGLVYRATGERALERAIWSSFYDDYDQGRVDKKSAKALAYVARAAQLFGGWKDANDTFRDAVEADPNGKEGARANLGWARLFLEKYDAGHAEQCVDDALKVLPDDPEAHTLLAAIKLEQGYDVAGALRELDKVRGDYAEAIAVRGKIAIETEQLDKARRYAETLLASNAEDLDGHTILAGVALVADDRKTYESERTRVLATNPRASRFFHELGELLTRNHRYAEAVPLEEEAIKVDPKDAVARAAYGANLLRLGREADGLTALREAWRGDKYNVRTYNLLQLYEDVIAKSYVTVEAPPFRFRMPTSERAVLEQTVVPFMQHAKKVLDGYYGFSPRLPITVELFTDPKHYAVRTVGLPGLDAIAVTFGPVVTAMSPSLGKFDWAMVLWHELSHVYAIEASRSRVPRWFTEGLSEYETSVANPRWTRRTSAELAGALQRNELLPVAELDQAFVAARDLAHMVVAYHESAAAVTYFVEKTGRSGVRKALQLFADGKPIPDVIATVTGQPVTAFDAGFRAWLKARLTIYEGQLLVRPSDYSDVETLELRVKTVPTDTRARGLLALARLEAGNTGEAGTLVGVAKPDDAAELKYARVRMLMALHKYDEAGKALTELRATAKGADVEVLTAQVDKIRGDVEGTWKALVAAGIADPDRSEPPMLMASLATATPRPSACADAVTCETTALERALVVEVMDPTIGKRLVKLLPATRRKDAIAAANDALEVAPFDGALRLDLVGLLIDANDPSATSELARARACTLSPQDKERAMKLEARLKKK